MSGQINRKILLVGNPNVGKSVIFTRLTGFMSKPPTILVQQSMSQRVKFSVVMIQQLS